MSRPAHPTEIRAEGNDDAMRQTLYGFCCRNNKDLLLLQWDTEKNAPDTPQTVSYGSQRKMWWRCEKGHSWQTAVYVRTSGAGCPICGGKMVQKGFNDLASFYPALAKEWDAEKNGALSPEAVTPASNRKAWWKCPLGHSYSAVISSRALRGSDCPYCTGSKALAGFNDLAAKAPEVRQQIHRRRL